MLGSDVVSAGLSNVPTPNIYGDVSLYAMWCIVDLESRSGFLTCSKDVSLIANVKIVQNTCSILREKSLSSAILPILCLRWVKMFV